MSPNNDSDDAKARALLRQTAFAAVRWTSVGSLTRAVVAFGQLIILSRLIAPAEYGAAALILALVTLATGISDAGLSSALIRFRNLTEREKSSLYWLNLGVGCLMTIAAVAISSPASSFYGMPALRELIWIVSPTFIFNAAGLQLRVSAERDLEFRRLVVAEVISSLMGAAVAIGFAMKGWGAYSIAIGQVTASIFLLVLTWLLLASRWRPSLSFSFGDVNRFMSFGVDMFLVNFVTAVSVQADILIAGSLVPSHILGFFTQPRDLCLRIMTTVNPIIARVGLPLMARHQSEPLLVGDLYLKTVRMSSSIMFPIFAIISILSGQIIEVILGPLWAPAADVLPTVALWFLARSVVNTVGSFLTALGKSRLALYYQCLVLMSVVVGTGVGALHGIEYVAPSLIFVYVMLTECVWLFILRPICCIGFIRYHEQFARPAVCALLAAVAGYLSCNAVDGSVSQILLVGSVSGIVYFGCSAVLNRGWMRDMMNFLKLNKTTKTPR